MYGVPGNYNFQQSRKRTTISIAVAAGVATLLSGATGFLLGLYQRNQNFPLFISLMIALGVAGYAFTRQVDKQVDLILKERRKYILGGEGEDLAGWLLEDLPDTYHIFHGIQLKDGADIDHIVVGPGGVTVISTKNFRGHLAYVPGQGLRHNNQARPELLRQTLRQAMAVRESLGALTQAELFVQAVLFVPWAALQMLAESSRELTRGSQQARG